MVLTDHSHWHQQKMVPVPIFADNDFYQRIRAMLHLAPQKRIRILAVYSYQVERNLYRQASLLEEDRKKEQLTQALDVLSARWGTMIVVRGRMLSAKQKVLDRIAFGKVESLV
jgi:diphthamide synthase (EF-2-diphthine--ammonia ligase)